MNFNGNRFLEQFVKMRQGLGSSNGQVQPIRGQGLPTKELTLEVLCESKPKDKIVKQYFQKRVDELTS